MTGSAGLETDVLVVGGGVMGCCAAYFLARAGVECIVIERGELNAQASGMNAGSLHVQIQSSMARDTDPAKQAAFESMIALNPDAVVAWRVLAEELEDDIEYRASGGLMVAETDDQVRLLEAKMARERACGLDVQLLDGGEVRAIAPYLSERVIAAEFCAAEGKVNPAAATPAIVRAAKADGARFRNHTELLALTIERGGFTARTTAGPIRAAKVVNACGAQAAAVAAMAGLDIPVRGKPLHMSVSEPTESVVPHLVQHAGAMLTLKQAARGNLLIGGGWPARANPDGADASVLRASIEGGLWVAQRIVPAICGLRLLRTWAGPSISTDGKAILGEAADAPGFIVAVSAHSGYTLAPLIGRAVAAIVQGKGAPFDIAPFSPARFAVRRSAAAS
jgi:glycine/D-amino acid oxidase-like deaminating enzyme